MPRLHTGAATDIPETTKLPLIPEDVWKQHREFQVIDFPKNSTTIIKNSTHTLAIKQRNDVESQTSQMRETPSQVCGSNTEPFLEIQTRNTPVQAHNDSTKQNSEIQRIETDMTTNDIVDDNDSPPKMTTSQIEEKFARDQITNKLYMPLLSTKILKRKKEMLYVPLDSENGLPIDVLVDSRAYDSSKTEKEMDRIKQQGPAKIFSSDDPPNF